MTIEDKTVKRVKGLDEVFCRSCGEPIKKEAEICPHCGVRNKTSIPSHRVSHDSSQYETTVSANWYKGVLVCTALWAFVLFIAIMLPESARAFMGFIVLIAWFGLPVCLYYDIQYVRANNEKWNPNTVLWLFGGFIWLINVLVVIIYLIRRQESMK